MFSRNFMKSFPIRKTGSYTAAHGTMSTDIYIIGHRDYYLARFCLAFFVTTAALHIVSQCHFFDDMFYHVPQPSMHKGYMYAIDKKTRQIIEQDLQKHRRILYVKDTKESLIYNELEK